MGERAKPVPPGIVQALQIFLDTHTVEHPAAVALQRMTQPGFLGTFCSLPQYIGKKIVLDAHRQKIRNPHILSLKPSPPALGQDTPSLALGIDLAVHFIKVREETTAHASDVKYATQGP